MGEYQAILMAAGVGSRISAHTNKPKSTLAVSGSNDTIIAHTLRMLRSNNFVVNLIVGYRKDSVKEQLKDYDVNYFENPYYRVTNSIASLWFAKAALIEAMENGQDVILGNADVFWGTELLEKILSDDCDCVMLADSHRVEVGDYFFNVNKDGVLIANGKQLPLEERNCEYVGIAKISSSFLPAFIDHLDRLIWNENYNMWWEDVLYSFKDESPVHVLDVEGRFWGEVDTLEDYQRIVDYIAEHPEELK